MPIYEYRCRKCGKISELLVGVGSYADELKCSHCGSTDLEKLMSAPAGFSFSQKSGGLACGRTTTCCGRSEPCEKPPCKK